MCPQHGIKHKAAINNRKYCAYTVIAAVCFILFCRHINKHSQEDHRLYLDASAVVFHRGELCTNYNPLKKEQIVLFAVRYLILMHTGV